MKGGREWRVGVEGVKGVKVGVKVGVEGGSGGSEGRE